jgi:hypothetical protein
MTTRRLTMALHLPKPIEISVVPENTHNADALASCFTADAIVRDEGHGRNGLTAIASWRREPERRYHHTVEPGAVAERNRKTVVSAEFLGNFPGSPVTLEFVFELKGAKIAPLEIES